MRVALIGARGIGKHHAAWWHLEGAEVCALAGSTPESAEIARSGLEKHIGFRGPGYGRVQEMLEREHPDIVDVCSPPDLHAQHVEAGLLAGCHVLCEKPFFFSPLLSSDDLLAEVQRLKDLAEERGRLLGVCTQYAVTGKSLASLWASENPGQPLQSFYGELASPAKGRPADPERVMWDLGPHPLSALQSLLPDARPIWEELRVSFSGYDARAFFPVESGRGQKRIPCEIYVHNVQDPPLNIRRFRLNDSLYDVEGYKDEHGIFQARIAGPQGAKDEEDAMRLLIRAFLTGAPVADGRFALTNTEWMLRILDAGRRG